jgi:hypothetical protein
MRRNEQQTRANKQIRYARNIVHTLPPGGEVNKGMPWAVNTSLCHLKLSFKKLQEVNRIVKFTLKLYTVNSQILKKRRKYQESEDLLL